MKELLQDQTNQQIVYANTEYCKVYNRIKIVYLAIAVLFLGAFLLKVLFIDPEIASSIFINIVLALVPSVQLVLFFKKNTKIIERISKKSKRKIALKYQVEFDQIACVNHKGKLNS